MCSRINAKQALLSAAGVAVDRFPAREGDGRTFSAPFNGGENSLLTKNSPLCYIKQISLECGQNSLAVATSRCLAYRKPQGRAEKWVSPRR